MRYVYSWRNAIAADAEEAIERFWDEWPDLETPEAHAEYVSYALGLDTDKAVLPFMWKELKVSKGDHQIIVSTTGSWASAYMSYLA